MHLASSFCAMAMPSEAGWLLPLLRDYVHALHIMQGQRRTSSLHMNPAVLLHESWSQLKGLPHLASPPCKRWQGVEAVSERMIAAVQGPAAASALTCSLQNVPGLHSTRLQLLGRTHFGWPSCTRPATRAVGRRMAAALREFEQRRGQQAGRTCHRVEAAAREHLHRADFAVCCAVGLLAGARLGGAVDHQPVEGPSCGHCGARHASSSSRASDAVQAQPQDRQRRARPQLLAWGCNCMLTAAWRQVAPPRYDGIHNAAAALARLPCCLIRWHLAVLLPRPSAARAVSGPFRSCICIFARAWVRLRSHMEGGREARRHHCRASQMRSPPAWPSPVSQLSCLA